MFSTQLITLNYPKGKIAKNNETEKRECSRDNPYFEGCMADPLPSLSKRVKASLKDYT